MGDARALPGSVGHRPRAWAPTALVGVTPALTRSGYPASRYMRSPLAAPVPGLAAPAGSTTTRAWGQTRVRRVGHGLAVALTLALSAPSGLTVAAEGPAAEDAGDELRASRRLRERAATLRAGAAAAAPSALTRDVGQIAILEHDGAPYTSAGPRLRVPAVVRVHAALRSPARTRPWRRRRRDRSRCRRNHHGPERPEDCPPASPT